MKTKEDLKILKEFFKSNDFISLKKIVNKFNIFDSLKNALKENAYSSLLTYFLDPKNNHSFKEKFAVEIFKELKIISKNVKNYYTRSYFNWKTTSGNLIDILVELRNKKNNSLKTVVGFELKTISKEREKQLSDYQKDIIKSYGNGYIIFLTPEGRKSATFDEKNKVPVIEMNYAELGEIIEKIIKGINITNINEKYFLLDFIEHLKELSSGGRKMTVKRYIEEMYNKDDNKKAMDAIIKYHPEKGFNNIRKLMFEKVIRSLYENSEEIESIYIEWCYPSTTNNPWEFNFVVNKINDSLPKKYIEEVGFYYMLYTGNKKEFELGDRFRCYLMMRNYGHERTFNKIYKKIYEKMPKFDEKLKREWDKWKCLWVSDKEVEINNYDDKNAEKLSNILIDAYNKTFKKLFSAIKSLK